MNDIDFHAARVALRDARRSARCVQALASACKPGELACAYRLQRAVAADLGPIRGWKISGLTTEQQRAMGVECPLAAPLLGPWLHPSGVYVVRRVCEELSARFGVSFLSSMNSSTLQSGRRK